jgi:hypothetical protein
MSIELNTNEIIEKKQSFNYDNLIDDLNNDLSSRVSKMNDNDINENSDYISSMTALELEYTEYLKKDLVKICEYYKISTRKKKKGDLIDDIIEYELNPENFLFTERRKMLWEYIYELIEDEYLNKYIIFN